MKLRSNHAKTQISHNHEMPNSSCIYKSRLQRQSYAYNYNAVPLPNMIQMKLVQNGTCHIFYSHFTACPNCRCASWSTVLFRRYLYKTFPPLSIFSPCVSHFRLLFHIRCPSHGNERKVYSYKVDLATPNPPCSCKLYAHALATVFCLSLDSSNCYFAPPQ